MNCPICSAPPHSSLAVDGHDYLYCADCQHHYLAYSPPPDHAAREFNNDYFFGAEGGYQDYLSGAPLLRSRGEMYLRLATRFLPSQPDPFRLLDVGCAAGFLSGPFLQAGWDVFGVEPNEEISTHARAQGIQVFPGILEDLPEEIGTFDLILLIQVAGHLIDPQLSFQKLSQIIAPSGIVILETWNGKSLTTRLLGPRWHEFNPPNVLHCFSPRSLTRLARRHSLSPITWKTTRKKILLDHGQSLLDQKFSTSWWYRKLLRPLLNLLPANAAIIYPADDLFWMILGKDPQSTP